MNYLPVDIINLILEFNGVQFYKNKYTKKIHIRFIQNSLLSYLFDDDCMHHEYFQFTNKPIYRLNIYRNDLELMLIFFTLDDYSGVEFKIYADIVQLRDNNRNFLLNNTLAVQISKIIFHIPYFEFHSLEKYII